MPRLVFRAEARQEAREARDWYEGKAHGLGLEFTRAINATVLRCFHHRRDPKVWRGSQRDT